MTLHLRRFGHGPRLTLALHPSLAHGGAFRALATQLPDRTFLCPDLPGHGDSPDWDGMQDLHDATTTAVEPLLVGHGPVDLIGHSFGGTVALRLALAHPGLVTSLTLIEPVLFAAAPRDARDTMAASFAPCVAIMAAGDMAAAAAAFQAFWSGPFAALSPPQQAYVATRMPLIAEASPALWDDSAGLLRAGGLESLPMPVTLIRGTLTPPVIPAIHAALSARIPQARDLAVAGAGHMLPITHPAQVAALVG